MSTKTWTLLDVENGIYLENLEILERIESSSGKNVECRITKKRLYGGLQDGVDVIEIDNGTMKFTVCPTRGMGVLHAKCGDWDLKWDAPSRGPVHPGFVPISDPSGLGWLDGFTEWVVRCGLESNGSPEFQKNGALKYSLHGRIANTPAHKVELSINTETGEIILTGFVEESRLFFKKMRLCVQYTVFPGEPGFHLRDTITNLSARKGEFEYLYHINTGFPLASPGARMLVPYEILAPRTAEAAAELDQWNTSEPETPGSAELVYFFVPGGDSDGNCRTLLIEKNENAAFSLQFSKKQFPYFCLWKSRLSNQDGYVIGFEPCINFPNTRSFEKKHGRVAVLESGQSRSFDLKFEILLEKGRITEEKQRLEELQRTLGGMIELAPNPQWSE